MAKASRKSTSPAARQRPGARPLSAVADAGRGKRVLLVAVGLYIAVLLAMVTLNSYMFILKSAVVPFLVLAALLSRRLTGFINDWAPFLAVVVLFDAVRSLAFATTAHFQLPMYAIYAIDWERWLCGGVIAPVALQAWRSTLADPAWLDRLFVLLHASHFLFFLLFGFVIWYVRRDAFRTYAVAMVALLYFALFVQFAVPTIPPWLAANEFQLLPPVPRLISSVYNVRLPTLVTVFDVNPIAAMPSLHTAMPGLCALLALRYFGRAGLPVAVYAVGVWVAVIYLGEHYLIDVVAGIGLVLLVFAGVVAWGAGVQGESSEPRRARLEPLPLFLTLGLIVAAFAIGELAGRWLAPLPVTRAFVQRELLERSPGAHYLLGRIAFDEGKFGEAQAELTRSLDEITGASDQSVIRTYLARSAYQQRDFAAVIAALEPSRSSSTDLGNLVLLGTAYAETNQYDKSLAVLGEARQRFPAEPEPLYWMTRLQYQQGRIDRSAVAETIKRLERFPSAKSLPLQRSLSALLGATRTAG